MKKINNLIIFLISFFVGTNLHAQDFVMSEIVSPDSLFFCKSQTFVVKALVKGYISDSFRISYQLGNRPRVEELVPKPTNVPTNSVLYTFRTPLTVPDSINDTLRVTVLTPDLSPDNNTLFIILRGAPTYTLPFTENFEQSRFPPLDWSATPVFAYDAGWTKNQVRLVNQNGQPTTAAYFWEGSEARYGVSPPERTFGALNLPAIDLKSKKNPYCVFNLGLPYEPYLSFSVDISTDCGVNFKTIYSKEGRYGKYYYAPTMSDNWTKDSVSLLPYIDSTVLIRFYAKHGNKDGQVIGAYVDSIRVYDAPILAKDAAINQIVSPALGSFCTSKFQIPVVVNIKNTGMTALDTFIISYQLEGTPSVSDTVVRNLAFGKTFNHTFSKPFEIPLNGEVNLSILLKVNGDEDQRNNILSLKDATFPRLKLPYFEDFESFYPYTRPQNFPDLAFNQGYDWFFDRDRIVIGSDGKQTRAIFPLYDRYRPAPYMSPPFLDLRNNPKPFLTFDLAYARLDSTILATTGRKEDTLYIKVSTDCGASYKTIYEKKGRDLTTSQRIINLREVDWIPNSAADWRRDTVDLTPFKDSVLLFRFVSLLGGYSALYVDNLKVEAGFDYDLGIIEKLQPASTLICASDRTTLPVRLAIRNNAFLTANTVRFSYQLDTEGVVSETLNRRINPRDTIQFQFRQLMNIATTGKHNLTIFITYSNDQNTKNDTLKTTFTIGNEYQPNLLEDFELAAFPPLDWQLKLTKAKGWDRILTVGSVNNQLTIVATADANYDRSEVGATESLISYPVDLRNTEKPTLIFDRFSPYISGDGNKDSLRIDVSTDCGITYQSTGYIKTGAALSTITELRFVPQASTDWKTDTLDLSAFKNRTIQVRFSRIFQSSRSNVMLDNIRFKGIIAKNLSLISFTNPVDTTPLCPDNPFILAFNVRNDGNQTVDSFTIKYKIDNQAEITERIRLSLQPNSLTAYKMPFLLRGVAAGQHKLRVVVNVVGDTENALDTLTQTINVRASVKVPFFESFNTVQNFPPADWIIQASNPNTWKKATIINKYGDATPVAYFGNVTNKGLTDGLLTPPIDLKNANKPRLIFDIACARFSNSSNDTLRIDLSTDCGLSYKKIYLKSGTNLATASNWASPTQWLPTSFLWRTDSVDLAAYSDSLILLRFVNIGNNGHQLYVDDVHIADSSAIVKTQETPYLASFSKVFPNPTTDNLDIIFDKRPTQSVKLVLLNAQGQLVKQEIKSLWDTPQYKWSLKDLPMGVYLLTIYNYPQFEQHKIIITK